MFTGTASDMDKVRELRKHLEVKLDCLEGMLRERKYMGGDVSTAFYYTKRLPS